MRPKLMKFYWKLEKIFHPKLRYSQYHYLDVLRAETPQDCDWLDLGCGHQMLAGWMGKEERELSARSRRLVGIDLDWEGLRANPIVTDRVFGNLAALPFRPDAFDLVTANMVVEHLEQPDAVLAQVHSVLHPGGKFIFHTPNSRSVMIRIASWLPQSIKNALALVLENRKEEDVFPTHYAMNTFPAIYGKAQANGFRVERLVAVSSSAVSQLLGPFAIIELLYLRLLEAPALARFRGNLIAILVKEDLPRTDSRA